MFLVLAAASGFTGPAIDGSVRELARWLGLALGAGGGLLALRGLYDLRRQVTPLPYPPDGARLVEEGAYRLVRHPIYGGIVLGGLGWALVTAAPAAFVMASVLFIFFDLKARREEVWLEERLPGYAAYRRRTRRLVPWLY
ncbi:MAG TPA: methyltransferase [Candidatus Binatia bacterium]|nr:methyltransferase [Candidatus Binatia bacterium]